MKMFKRLDKPFGQVMVERGLITSEQLAKALEIQRSLGGMLGEILVDLGFISEVDIANALSLIYGIPFLPLEGYEPSAELKSMVPRRIADHYLIAPIDKIGSSVTLAMLNPMNADAIEDVELMTKCEAQVFVSTRSMIKDMIDRIYCKDTK
jgi:type IV pilus assembly protein PilB